MSAFAGARDRSSDSDPDARPRGARGRPHQGPRALATLIVWISVIYFLTPLVWLAFASTKANQDLFTTFGLWFGDSVQFSENVVKTLTYNDGLYVRWLANSFAYATASAIGAAVLATLAGYSLAKFDFPGRRALNLIVMGAIMIPIAALAIPTYLVFAAIGLVNTPLAAILPAMVSPFAVFLMREYSKAAVDQSLLESARIDGAGELLIFRRIAIPLLSPGIATVLLFNFVAGFNNYFLPLLMLNKSELLPITVGLARWFSLGGANATGAYEVSYFPMVLAGSVMATVPLIIAFLYLQRYWQSGLSTGSIKG